MNSRQDDSSPSGLPPAEPPLTPPLNAPLDVDVAVIGGGIAGLTAALALKRAGQTVAVLEAARVGTGVTGNTTGKVTSLHRLAYSELAARHGAGTAATYGQANEAAIEHIAGVVAAEGIDCGFRRVANYTYAESGPALELVREEAALAGRLGLPASFTTDVPLPFAVMGAVRFDGQAQIHALRYVQGLARAVNGDGSFVFEESPATGFRDGSPAVVELRSGDQSARRTSSSRRTCRSVTTDSSPSGAMRTARISSPDAAPFLRWTQPLSALTSRCAPS